MRVFLPDDSSPKIPIKREDDFNWIENSHKDEHEISPASLWSVDEENEPAETPAAELPRSSAWITKPDVSDDNYVWNDHASRSPWWSEDLLAEFEAASVEPLAVSRPESNEVLSETSRDEEAFPLTGDDDDEVTVVNARSFDDDEDQVAEEALALEEQIEHSVQSEPKTPTRVLDESAVLPHEASYATVALYQEEEVHDQSPQQEEVLDDATVLPHEASFATVPLFADEYRKHSAVREFANKFAFSAKRVIPVVLVVLFAGVLVVLGIKAISSLSQQEPRFEAATPAETPAPTSSESKVAPPVDSTPLLETPPSDVLTTEKEEKEKEISKPAEEIRSRDLKLVEVATKPRASRSRQSGDVTSERRNARVKVAAERSVKKRDSTPKQAVAKQPKPREAKVEAKVESSPAPAQPKRETPVKPQPTGGGERPRRVNPDGR